MTENAPTSQHIPGVGTVYLPVTDQDRALAFYRDQLGFEVRTDSEGEGFRWIEVAPAGAYTVIALVPPTEEDGPQPGGSAPFGFDTPNLEAAIAEFAARGVVFEDVMGGEGTGMPAMAYFRDPDGNRLLLVEDARCGLGNENVPHRCESVRDVLCDLRLIRRSTERSLTWGFARDGNRRQKSLTWNCSVDDGWH